MTTRFRTYRARSSADGPAFESVGSASLYLDTSDLSYLLLGRLQTDTMRPPQWRARIEALLAADSVRLRVSAVHLAELALRPELYPRALEALRSCPNVYLVTSRGDSVFRAELERQPVVLVEHRLSAADLANLDLQTRWLGFDVSGSGLARFIKVIAGLEAKARNLGKAAQKSNNDEARKKLALKLLRGESDAFPMWIRPAATAFSRYAPRIAERIGLPPNIIERVIKEETRGLSWAATLAPNARLPRKEGRKWKQEDVRAMPATILRTCVENVHADPNRPAEDRTRYDVEHLAFVAYSDFSTVDGPNLDALKPPLAHLSHLRVFKTGNLDPLLDAMEKADEIP